MFKIIIASLLLVACGSESEAPEDAATGGSASSTLTMTEATGGEAAMAATGGATAVLQATGGQTTQATGGHASTGGQAGTGGQNATGGNQACGALACVALQKTSSAVGYVEAIDQCTGAVECCSCTATRVDKYGNAIMECGLNYVGRCPGY